MRTPTWRCAAVTCRTERPAHNLAASRGRFLHRMIGCFAQASDTDIVVDTAELEDTRWFSRPEAAARERMRARCRRPSCSPSPIICCMRTSLRVPRSSVAGVKGSADSHLLRSFRKRLPLTRAWWTFYHARHSSVEVVTVQTQAASHFALKRLMTEWTTRRAHERTPDDLSEPLCAMRVPDRKRAMGDIADHIRKFWEPRMRRQILEYLDEASCAT
jgi:NADH-dependant formate dehydrogenase delta subunit FdsD